MRGVQFRQHAMCQKFDTQKQFGSDRSTNIQNKKGRGAAWEIIKLTSISILPFRLPMSSSSLLRKLPLKMPHKSDPIKTYSVGRWSSVSFKTNFSDFEILKLHVNLSLCFYFTLLFVLVKQNQRYNNLLSYFRVKNTLM